MSAQPRVSIVLPVYNGEKYLRLSVESVLAQTDPDWELIIVDDCSQDSTPQIIAAYCARDSRIRSIRHDTNKRLPGGLNTGHNAARGRFMTWTSDDNLYHADFVAEMVAFLETNPHIGFVYGDFNVIDGEGRITGHRDVPPPEELARGCIVGASFLYRREVWEKVGPYDPEMCLCEDWDYWLRCLQATPMAVLRKTLYDYRMHGDSLTTQQRTRQSVAGEKVLRKHLPRIAFSPRVLRAQGWLWVVGVARRRRDFIGAFGGFWRALVLAPVLTIVTLLKVLGAGLKNRFSLDT